MAVTLQTQAINGEQVLYIGPAALVASKSEPGHWYIVEGGRCSCPGFAHRGRCRHLGAAAEAERSDRATAVPAASVPTYTPRPRRKPWHPELPTCQRHPCRNEVVAWGDTCGQCAPHLPDAEVAAFIRRSQSAE